LQKETFIVELESAKKRKGHRRHQMMMSLAALITFQVVAASQWRAIILSVK